MYAFKALIALKSRALRGSKARLRTSAAHAPPQPSGAGRWRCCTGRQMRRRSFASKGSRAVEDERTSEAKWPQGAAKEGTAFRSIRPPIAQQSRADRPLTGAANECRLKGGTRKHHPTHHHAEHYWQHFSSSAAAAAVSALRREFAVAVALPSPATSTATVTTGACDGPFTESTVYTGFLEGFIDCEMT